MFTKGELSRVGSMIITALALGWSTGPNAQASDRGTSQTRVVAGASAARDRTADLARAGGWAYKTGLVERAQREAERHERERDQAVAWAHGCPPPSAPSPEQAAALARLTELRQAGGWAYKTGAVARAERDVQSLSVGAEAEPVAVSPAQVAARARLTELRQAGGWAFKTGAVARAEREGQALASPAPTSICQGREAQARATMTSMR
jgi:hypothetical protein